MLASGLAICDFGCDGGELVGAYFMRIGDIGRDVCWLSWTVVVCGRNILSVEESVGMG